ncbi:LysM domain-containing protein [Micromonospora purpureochromogenes]|uniref:LysM domain-containing protein n=1 Tax=Micromonospora purpureochromogenes TaxID=47872 RepID=A0A1C4UER3_9ACTN|nr:LysM domain-containing protein [Micromonospora purpureochromogenes]SCE70185.1 LysM domain-containing protein [Micromonospora purpureochromogenes]
MTASRGSAVRRTGQLLTGFGSLVVLVALLVGAPVALLAFAGNPLPDQLPTLSEVGTALTSRDDGRLFLRALAVVGWFGWATFAFSVLVELAAQATRRPAPRLPGMSRQQRAAAALVGSVALIIAASPAASAAAAMTYPATAGTGHPTTGAAVPATGATVVLAAPPVGSTGSVPEGAGAEAARPQPAPPVYRVAKGDYLGGVAERYLDDFDGYREVARLNRLQDADRIRPGQLIKLPARAEDDGVRRHATGRLVAGPSTPRKPSPHPPAASPQQPPHSTPLPDEQAGPDTPGGQAGPGGTDATPGQPAPRTMPPQVERPAGAPPAMAAGASRATDDEGMNRPLAVSAVLAVASIVGAQIGAVLGLRRRPARAVAAARARHRRD